MTDWLPLFEAALGHPTPLLALRALAQGLLADGIDRADVVAIVDEVQATLQEQGREADEDNILDLLDQLTGWTTPGTAI